MGQKNIHKQNGRRLQLLLSVGLLAFFVFAAAGLNLQKGKVRADPLTTDQILDNGTKVWKTGVDNSGNRLIGGQPGFVTDLKSSMSSSALYAKYARSDPHWRIRSVVRPPGYGGATCQFSYNGSGLVSMASPTPAYVIVPGADGGINVGYQTHRRADIVGSNPYTSPDGFQWQVYDTSSGWIGQNIFGQNYGEGRGCKDPSADSSSDYSKANIYQFEMIGKFDIKDSVDLATVQIVVNGIVDNRVKAYVNGCELKGSMPGASASDLKDGWVRTRHGSTARSFIFENPSGSPCFTRKGNTLRFDVQSTYTLTGLLITNIGLQAQSNVVVVPGTRPYVSVGAGDVVAGAPVMTSAAGNTCTAQNAQAGIAGWNNNLPGYAGAGGKFGVTALAGITGFASAQGSSQSGAGLSFANTGSSPSSGQYGGSFGSGGICWSPPSTNVTTSAGDTLGGMTVQPGEHKTIHYTGDLYIANNIVYAEGWGNLRDIPGLVIYVDGNIYIDAGVTRLDGTYAARPTSATAGGTIYTCATPGNRSNIATEPDYFNICKNQLVVNGSLIGKAIKFLRTCGTVGQAVANEPVTTTGGTDKGTCGAGSHAAEVINNGPADWLGRGNMDAVTNDQWNSVVSLPPVL